MSRAYISKADMGDQVFGLLTTDDPTLEEACKLLCITPAQFRSGLEYIKDILATDRGSPITYDPQTHRYALALSSESRQVREYEIYRLKIMRKQLGRLTTGTAEPAVQMFGTISSRRFLKHLKGAVEELDLLLAELGT